MDYAKELRAHLPKHETKAVNTYNWMLTVIASCRNTKHTSICKLMIEGFNMLYDNDELTAKLNEVLEAKYYQVAIDIP